jgi:beta-phosphoglucomutase
MIKAVIFDFDGTIANSEPIHYELFAKVMREEEILISKEENDRYYLHLNDQDSFNLALKRHDKISTPEFVADLVRRKSIYYNNRISTGDLLFEDAGNFIRKAASAYLIAIASGALDGEIEFILGRAGLLEYFPVIIGAEKTVKGKPHPECYLKALQGLNAHFRKNPEIKPGEVLVIEDSIGGIEGAHYAGMACLAVTNSYSKKELREADFVVDSLSKIEFKTIQARLQR